MRKFLVVFVAIVLTGCGSQEIPAGHKGKMFDSTGALALFVGGSGLSGPVLSAGTYWTGIYDRVLAVDCRTVTIREPMTALTQDGVQFGIDVYTRFSAASTDEAVERILRSLPTENDVIVPQALFNTFIRPKLGESIREIISPYRANDINPAREKILEDVRTHFTTTIGEVKELAIYDITLSNMDFPEAMDEANTRRSVQGIERDRAIAERERVNAEFETTELRVRLSEKEGEVAAAKIRQVGRALQEFPEYLTWELQNMMPAIYEKAGACGNMIIAAPSPSILVSPKSPAK